MRRRKRRRRWRQASFGTYESFGATLLMYQHIINKLFQRMNTTNMNFFQDHISVWSSSLRETERNGRDDLGPGNKFVLGWRTRHLTYDSTHGHLIFFENKFAKRNMDSQTSFDIAHMHVSEQKLELYKFRFHHLIIHHLPWFGNY